jgi:hypothetical protein
VEVRVRLIGEARRGQQALGKQEAGMEPPGPASCLGGCLPFEGLNESVNHVVNGGPRELHER